MCFDNSRKQFLFLTTDALSNRNRNLTLPGRCSVSQVLSQCLFPHWFIKSYLTLQNGNVINDVMGTWQITYITIHLHLYICKLLFVRYHFILFKSSGQTKVMPNKHTNTIAEGITSLSRVINKMNVDKHDQIWTHTPKYFKNVCRSSTFNMHVHEVSSPDWPGHRSCYLQHSLRRVA